VEVRGPRVLTDGHRAVLAVDDRLRYTPLKAGYHGGASAAEVIVPVAVLLPDEDTNTAGLHLLPPQFPSWWLTEVSVTAVATGPQPAPAGRAPRKARKPSDQGSTLFDVGPEPEPASAPKPVAAPSLGRAVVAGAVYRSQRKVAGRLIVTDDQVVAFVDALSSANSARLPRALAAQALGVNQTRLAGALAQVQQLLNVEGYAVLSADPATGTVMLDAQLLRDQFEVRP